MSAPSLDVADPWEVDFDMTIECAASKDNARWWIISVSGYGSFAFHGTEESAEEMRAHKARWEAGIGRKRPADTSNAEDLRLISLEER